MDVTVVLVCPAAHLILLRDEDRALQQTGPAPAAFAGAAAGRRLDTGTLDGYQHGLISRSGDGALLRTLFYLDAELLALGFLRVAFALPRRLGDVDELAAEEPLGQAELFNLGLEELVHGFGAAEED